MSENENEYVYIKMTKEQRKALYTMINSLADLVKENHADLLGARDSLMTVATNLVEDNRREKRAYWVQFEVNVEDITGYVDLNYHMSDYDAPEREITDYISRQVGDDDLLRNADISVHDVRWDTDSEVSYGGTARLYFNSMEIEVDADLDRYDPEIKEMLRERVLDRVPGLDGLDWSVTDVGFNGSEKIGVIDPDGVLEKDEDDTLAAE